MITRRKLGEAFDLLQSFRLPFPLGQVAQLPPSQTENGRDAQHGQLVKLAVPQFSNLLRTHSCALGQIGIGKAQPALRFSQHIGKVVF